MTLSESWWKARKGKAHERVFPYVGSIQTTQGDVFNRLGKLESLYDAYSPMGDDEGDSERKLANVTENVVASNVDTVYAAIATTQVRARFMTDDANWSMQRRARHLEWYAEGLQKQLGVHRKCRLAFKEAAKKGNGLVKVYADRWNDLRVEHVFLEDIVVPDSDARSDAPPLQLHHVMRNIDKEQLKAEYPEHADAIDAATRRSVRATGFKAYTEGKITVIESIRLPVGRRPKKGDKPTKGGPKYIAGRRVLSIENADLVDEPYHKHHYPFAMITWSDRAGSFYGISGAERIAGIQRALNKRNWQIDRTLDQNANLTTYVRPIDANLLVKSSKVGNLGICRGDYPHTPNPPVVHAETYQSRLQLKDSAFEEFGVSRLAAQSHKPAGLDSGVALREYRDQTTQRFAPQESDFEQLVLDTVWLLVDCCKDLGSAAPMVIRTSKWSKQLAWSKVDMGEVKVQIAASSTLARTPAGRMQTVVEWAQAGVITQDEARRLLRHPDLERAMSLYTAALESIEEQLEAILDGNIIVPEPFDNLKMIAWRGTAEYHNVRIAGAPERILEALRTYIVQAAHIESLKATPAQNVNAQPGAMPMALMPGAMPAGMPAPPAAAPQSAFAQQAMDLMAG